MRKHERTRISSLNSFDRFQSIFSMEDIRIILNLDFEDSKRYVTTMISRLQPQMTYTGYQKISEIVRTSKSSINLAQKISNYILAHPENNLRVI